MLLAERAKDLDVAIGQVRSARVAQPVPVAARRQVDCAFLGHLQEQEVGDLLYVVAVVHTLVAKRVAEAPEPLRYIGHAAIASFSSLSTGPNLPSKVLLALPQPPLRTKI